MDFNAAYNNVQQLTSDFKEQISTHNTYDNSTNGQQVFNDLLQALECIANCKTPTHKPELIELCSEWRELLGNDGKHRSGFSALLAREKGISARERLKIFAQIQYYITCVESNCENCGQQPEPPFTIDERLTTERAKKMFRRFADEGYIKINEGGHYEWKKTKIALCFFTYKAFHDYLKLEKNTWSVFEKLFNEKQLQSYYKNHEFDFDDNEECKCIKGIFTRNNF